MIHTTEPLEPEDIAILYQGVKKPSAGIIVFLVLFITAGFLGSWSIDTWIPFAACLIFALMVPGWYFLQKSSAKALTEKGIKSIYKGIIEKKILKTEKVEGYGDDFPGENRYYFFRVGGRDFTVPSGYYDTFNEGDSIILHATIPSDIIFNITAGR